MENHQLYSGQEQTLAADAYLIFTYLASGKDESGTQSTYRGLGSIDIAAVVRSILFVGKVKDDPTTRVIVHEKSSLAPPGQALAFSLGDQKGFRWIGAYDISAEDLLAGGEGTKAELKQEQAVKLIYELLSDGREVSGQS